MKLLGSRRLLMSLFAFCLSCAFFSNVTFLFHTGGSHSNWAVYTDTHMDMDMNMDTDKSNVEVPIHHVSALYYRPSINRGHFISRLCDFYKLQLYFNPDFNISETEYWNVGNDSELSSNPNLKALVDGARGMEKLFVMNDYLRHLKQEYTKANRLHLLPNAIIIFSDIDTTFFVSKRELVDSFLSIPEFQNKVVFNGEYLCSPKELSPLCNRAVQRQRLSQLRNTSEPLLNVDIGKTNVKNLPLALYLNSGLYIGKYEIVNEMIQLLIKAMKSRQAPFWKADGSGFALNEDQGWFATQYLLYANESQFAMGYDKIRVDADNQLFQTFIHDLRFRTQDRVRMRLSEDNTSVRFYNQQTRQYPKAGHFNAWSGGGQFRKSIFNVAKEDFGIDLQKPINHTFPIFVRDKVYDFQTLCG